MRAHLVQMDVVWEDKGANRATAERLISAAGVERGDLVVLPEMFETGFSMNVERTADVGGEGCAWMSSMASRFGVTLMGGISVRAEDGWGLNRALVFDSDGRGVGRYDKVHPFSYGREAERFRGGARVCVCGWKTPENKGETRVCPIVCYDLRFPELFRAGRMLGGEVFVVMANWPSERVEHWLALLRARAIENQAIVLGVNRAGKDPYLSYPGASVAFDGKGERVAFGGAEECVVGVEVDVGACRAWREAFPAWSDVKRGLLPRVDGGGEFEV